MTGLSKTALILAIIFMLNPAIAKDGGKRTSATADTSQVKPAKKGTTTVKDDKGTKKRDAIIDFLQKLSTINPQLK